MTWLQTVDKLFPLTVLAAVVLFVAKEIIEAIRRRGDKARKARAIKGLLIEEIELNHWTIGSLRDTLETIEQQHKDDPSTEFALKVDASGGTHFRSYRPDQKGGAGSGRAIPLVHRKQFDTFLPALAELDKSLFEQVRNGYSRIGDLEHIRSSLIAYLAEEDPAEKRHLIAFPSYGLRVLREVDEAIRPLYKSFAGKELQKARIR